ncbi:SGNH/GDSL hydrolase family protein [Pseudarthrobacter siccitolerans]
MTFAAEQIRAQYPVVSPEVTAYYENNKALKTEAPDPRDKAVFFGDSYTHGTGASSSATRWTTLVAKNFDWNEINMGSGGTGYVTASGKNGCGQAYCPTFPEMIAKTSVDKPKFVIIAGGQNDFKTAKDNPQPVIDAITATFNAAKAKFPEARLIAVGPSTPASSISPHVVALDGAVQAAAAATGATYVSLLNPEVIDHATMMAPDGGHVNDAGHAAIAERVLTALR